jgi:hypothetical protein
MPLLTKRVVDMTDADLRRVFQAGVVNGVLLAMVLLAGIAFLLGIVYSLVRVLVR